MQDSGSSELESSCLIFVYVIIGYGDEEQCYHSHQHLQIKILLYGSHCITHRPSLLMKEHSCTSLLHARTHTRAQTLALRHTRSDTRTHTLTHTRAPTHTPSDTNAHAHTHTHTHLVFHAALGSLWIISSLFRHLCAYL